MCSASSATKTAHRLEVRFTSPRYRQTKYSATSTTTKRRGYRDAAPARRTKSPCANVVSQGGIMSASIIATRSVVSHLAPWGGTKTHISDR